MYCALKDRSINRGRGGGDYKTGEGGAGQVLLLQKGGVEKSLAILKGGGHTKL